MTVTNCIGLQKNDFKTGVKGVAIVAIPCAIVVILGLGAYFGILGSDAQLFMTKSVMPFLTENVGVAPRWSLLLIGAISLNGICFAVGCFISTFVNRKKQMSIESESEETGVVFLPELEPKKIPELMSEEAIQSWLPQWVFSEKGLLAINHLLYFLRGQKLKEDEMDAVILWSFSKRKFLSQPSHMDTILGIKGSRMLPNSLLRVNQKGFAISNSKHLPELQSFVADNEILRIEEPVRVECIQEDLYKGIYSDGTCIIQQPGVRACVYTTAAMLLTDRGVKFDFEALFSTNLTTDSGLDDLLKKYGFTLCQTYINDHEEWFSKEQGPLFAGIISDSIGAHKVIIDVVAKDRVLMRDPNHGWRITMTRERFFSMTPTFQTLLKIEEKISNEQSKYLGYKYRRRKKDSD